MLMLLNSIAFSQPSTNYCMPIETARLLAEDAVKKRVLDTLVNTQSQKIQLLTDQNFKTYNDFQALLSIERQKLQTQKEITLHSESISTVYKEENKYLKKKVRRLKWQRIGLGALVVVVVGISI